MRVRAKSFADWLAAQRALVHILDLKVKLSTYLEGHRQAYLGAAAN